MRFSVVVVFSISIFSENNAFQLDNSIEFKESSYESYLLNNEKIVLQSKGGALNLDNKDIILTGEVEGTFFIDGEVFNIKTESLSGNLLSKLISSKEGVLFEAKGLEIVSSTMEIVQKPKEGLIVLFRNANLNQVNLESTMLKGEASKIKFFVSKNLILMEGNAVFYENNMKIISDELQYDLKEDRILRSVNAKIINNL